MSFMRKRLSYANVVMTLALVFAMSGGAYAAKRYLITSTKQISPKVLQALKGDRGAQGPAGAAGVAGAQGVPGPKGDPGAAGSQGPAGPKGETGAQGAQGPAGPKGSTGAAGPQGSAGSPWTAGGTLPSGATETGSWSQSFLANSVGLQTLGVFIPITWSIPLSADLDSGHIHYIAPGAAAPPACEEPNHPGEASVSNPEATPGNLCVYAGQILNATVGGDESITAASGASASASAVGAVLRVLPAEQFNYGLDNTYPGFALGSFAVTGA